MIAEVGMVGHVQCGLCSAGHELLLPPVVRFRRRLGGIFWYGLTIVVAVCASHAADAQLPQPCLFPDPIRGDFGLPLNHPHVITRDIHLRNMATQKDFEARTYSATAPSGAVRSEQCFRYEIRNVDKTGDIGNLYWGLAGISIDPLKASAMRANVRRLQILENPIEVNSEVDAFENSKDETRAWADRTVALQTGTLEGSPEPQLAHLAYSDLNPALPGIIRATGLPDVPLTAYLLNDKARATPEQVNVYGDLTFNIQVRSQAVLDGQKVIFTTTIYASGGELSSAKFAFPFLVAIDRLRQKFGDEALQKLGYLDAYKMFFSFYREVRPQLVSNEGKWRFASEFGANDPTIARAFRVDYPIRVQHGDTSDCVVVSSLSIIPLSFPLDECNRIGHP